MIIKKIEVSTSGFVNCRSRFYTALDILSDKNKYTFSQGINWLYGDIDSGGWAVSYYLSMLETRPKDFHVQGTSSIFVNDELVPTKDVLCHSCYMDETVYPLFSQKQSVRKLVTKAIKANGLNCSADDIKDMFCLDAQRFERPIAYVGNERFRAMAAVAHCNNKQVYCFPWLSKMRFDSYCANISTLLEMLASLKKIVIVPVGRTQNTGDGSLC